MSCRRWEPSRRTWTLEPQGRSLEWVARRRSWLCRGLAALALSAAPGCTLASEPKGKLTAESRAQGSCRAEVVRSLVALRDALGFGFEVSDADVDALHQPGNLEKTYARDGALISADIGVDVTEGGGCSLRVWARSVKTPTVTETSSGTFGSQPAPGCRCTSR